jgi:uncharacterized lipoprotein YddW (UPF0748 family)
MSFENSARASFARDAFLNPSVLPAIAAIFVALFLAKSLCAQQPEFRAMWADTFHPALRNASDVSQIVRDARAGNFNAIIVEVRKRGDAYYNSNFEPKASDVSPQSYDPLADLILKARDTTQGPPIEVHAWIVTYHIWNSQNTLPPQPDHPFLRHPDWLTKNFAGEMWDSTIRNYTFDPGHPEVQQYTFDVAMDLISRYDIDGFNFDYIRYSGRTWGYHDTAVARFNARFNRTGLPAPTDPDWMQFRRDQITALVRKIYLSAISIKPHITISADTICWTPSVTTDAQWYSSSAAWGHVFQDWRGWMEEGIIDLNIPMAYFRQPVNGADFLNWSTYAKNRRFNRHVAIGPGTYLNSVSDALEQMRSTRDLTAAGNRADGVSIYSYYASALGIDFQSRSNFYAALTQTNSYEIDVEPIFKTWVPTPQMPWKTAPTKGYLKGFARHPGSNHGIDGATVLLTGPVNRTLVSDATGFFGWAELPPGAYTLTATHSNLVTDTFSVAVTAGNVSTQDIPMREPPVPVIGGIEVFAGPTEALIRWTTLVPTDAQVEFGLGTNFGSFSARGQVPGTNHVVFLAGLLPNTAYFFRALSTEGTNTHRSSQARFSTAGDLIVDNPAASFSGNWILATSATDKYGADYHYAMAVSGAATATASFIPQITTPGNYDVYLWYSQGSNRSTNAPVQVIFDGGTFSTNVNQTTGGGRWRLIASERRFARGESGAVRVANNSAESSKVIIADAVKWVYRASQPSPYGPLPEWWALGYSQPDANADTDQDGYSAYAEYLFGTDPNSDASRLEVSIEDAGSGGRVVFHPYVPGRRYRLAFKEHWDDGPWQILDEAPVAWANGGAFELGANSPGGFYRLMVDLEP